MSNDMITVIFILSLPVCNVCITKEGTVGKLLIDFIYEAPRLFQYMRMVIELEM